MLCALGRLPAPSSEPHDGRRCLRRVLKKVPSPCASSLTLPTLSPPFAARLAYAAGIFFDMQVSHPFRPSPRLPSARPRRAAHPLPRCARTRHGRRPPRSPPLRAAGAQPRAGHLHINPGEANGPKRERAPLPGGRRVHLGSVCWVGRWCAMSCRHSPRGVGGRASGGSSLSVSRAAAAPFIWSLVMYF